MANRTRRDKKRTQDEKIQYLIVASFIALIIGAATIYFRAQTGWFGRVIGGGFFKLFGVTAYAVPPLILLFLVAGVVHALHGKLLRTLLYLVALFFCISMLFSVSDLPLASFQTTVALSAERGEILRGAGMLGGVLSFVFRRFIGEIGLWLLFSFVLFFFVLHLFDVKLLEFFNIVTHWIAAGWSKAGDVHASLQASAEKRRNEKREREITEHRADFSRNRHDEVVTQNPEAENRRFHPEPLFEEETLENDSSETAPIRIKNYNDRTLSAEKKTSLSKAEPPSDVPSKVTKKDEKDKSEDVQDFGTSTDVADEKTYITPPIALLKTGEQSGSASTENLEEQARKIETTLDSFGIESRVVSIQRGPTVTQFELKPQAGVKVSRITNLADDLALALAAQDIRIEAPIPGKPYVGVEVPNKVSDTVWLRDILQSDAFIRSDSGIPIALGQSIDGDPVIAKISKMPHLLIAGATGSGKSVCINTIIMSILYKYAPSEVRLILIDPKVVELSVYSDIPHLMIPVVTDPKKAARALYTLVKEMERRFRLFSQYSVRDIGGYREQQKIDESMENLPYIVLIIDELSDLMMVASKDVEAHITRLAQMARACGIHLIIATQRPSVDVITGTIKANIPSRISFAVSSSVDSRTILDQSGAEKLLGKGDMLYYPSNFPKPKRVQGAFVSDAEVSKVTQFLTDQHTVSYDKDLVASIEKETEVSRDDEDAPQDALMDEVLEFISHEETTSISGLQRRFRIGYARAGRIIDELEAMGAISSQDGSKPREVYLHESSWQEDEDESAE